MKTFDYDNLILGEKVFGLELSGHSVKVMELKRSANKYSTSGYSEVPIDPDALSQEIIVKPKVVARAIKTAREKARPHKIRRKYASVVLPDSKVFVRIIKFPAEMTKEEIRDAVEWKAKDLIPMPLEQVYWDWHRLDTKEQEEEIEVVVSAVEKECADSYSKTLKLLNITPLYYDISGNAAARFIFQSEYKNKKALLVRIDKTSITISLFLKGGVRYHTVIQDTLKGGYGILIDYTASQLGIDPEKAEQLVLSPSEQNPKLKSLLKNFFEAKFDHLKSEIRQVLEYYEQTLHSPNNKKKTKDKEDKLEGIFLYGKGAKIFYLDEYLSEQSLPINNEIISSQSTSSIIKFIGETNLHGNLVLLGLSIRNLGLFKELRDINLVPKAIKSGYLQTSIYSSLHTYLRIVFWNIFIIATVLGFATGFSQIYKKNIEEELKSVKNVSESAANQRLENEIGALNKSSEQIKNLLSTQTNWDYFFQELSSKRGSGITYTSLIVSEEQDAYKTIAGDGKSVSRPNSLFVIINGTASSREHLQEYIFSMENSEVFEEVKMPISNFELSTNIEFTIYCFADKSMLSKS